MNCVEMHGVSTIEATTGQLGQSRVLAVLCLNHSTMSVLLQGSDIESTLSSINELEEALEMAQEQVGALQGVGSWGSHPMLP